MEVLKDLLKEEPDPNLLAGLKSFRATNVAGLLALFQGEPTERKLKVFGLTDPDVWPILKASIEARIGKKSNTKILPKRA